MLKAVVCDWNRTLFEDEYEIEFFRGLAQRAARNFLTRWKLAKLFRLWQAKKRCEAIYRRVAGVPLVNQKAALIEVLEILNRAVIDGLPNGVLDNYLPDYAVEARCRLDQRLLRPLRQARERHGLLLGIISSGCDTAIKRTLTVGGFSFDFVKANEFDRNGRRVGAFRLQIYDNKAEILRTFLAERGIESSAVMYIGDDFQDEECMRMVRFPVVSFLAHPENRLSLQKGVNAYAPDSEEEFDRYLREALK